jgi:hypothetical protein
MQHRVHAVGGLARSQREAALGDGVSDSGPGGADVMGEHASPAEDPLDHVDP